MLGKTVLISVIALLAVAYCAAPLLSLSARRRRDARALRRWVLKDIDAGIRSRSDETVTHVLNWCDQVVETGQDVPLLSQSH